MPQRPRKPKPKPEPLDADALYNHAVRLLAIRMRTSSALTKLLARRAAPGPLGESNIQAVLRRLVANNYLNDERFAADFTRLRQENERFGRRRVAQELRHHGLPQDTIQKTLDAAYSTTDELALCRAHIQRKRLQPPQDQKETARIVARLLRAGFSANTIFRALKQGRVTDDLLEGIESIQAEQEHSDES